MEDAWRPARRPENTPQQAFATTVGERIVPVQGTPPDGIYASSTTTANRQFIKLVNVSGERVPVDLLLPSAEGTAACTTLCAPPDARNKLAADGTITEQVAPQRSNLDIRAGRLQVTLAPHSLLSLEIPLARDTPVPPMLWVPKTRAT